MMSGRSIHFEGQSVDSTVRINAFAQSGGMIKQVTQVGGSYQYYYDEGNHQAFLPHLNETCIWLNSLHSGTPRSGFGTTAFRTLIAESIEKGCPGKIQVDAAWSSHLFYIFMGMIPYDRKLNYLRSFHGISGELSVKKLQEIHPIDLHDEEKINPYLVKRLKSILEDEKKIPSGKVSFADVILNYDFLVDLKSKPCSYLHDEFINALLLTYEEYLESKKGEKYPDTNSLGGVIMKMSAEGSERWLAAMKDNKPFIPFRRFEHLRPFMNAEQASRLDMILQALDIQVERKHSTQSSSIMLAAGMFSKSTSSQATAAESTAAKTPPRPKTPGFNASEE